MFAQGGQAERAVVIRVESPEPILKDASSSIRAAHAKTRLAACPVGGCRPRPCAGARAAPQRPPRCGGTSTCSCALASPGGRGIADVPPYPCRSPADAPEGRCRPTRRNHGGIARDRSPVEGGPVAHPFTTRGDVREASSPLAPFDPRLAARNTMEPGHSIPPRSYGCRLRPVLGIVEASPKRECVPEPAHGGRQPDDRSGCDAPGEHVVHAEPHRGQDGDREEQEPTDRQMLVRDEGLLLVLDAFRVQPFESEAVIAGGGDQEDGRQCGERARWRRRRVACWSCSTIVRSAGRSGGTPSTPGRRAARRGISSTTRSVCDRVSRPRTRACRSSPRPMDGYLQAAEVVRVRPSVVRLGCCPGNHG